MTVSEGLGCNPNTAQVVESRDMPPLPVSKIKLSVSGILFSLAVTIITPPLYCLNGNFVSSLALAGEEVKFCAMLWPGEKKSHKMKMKFLI